MASPDLESTVSLLRRARDGDESARNTLLARYLPLLRRWAHGRLPVGLRDLSDTDDLVQATFIRVLKHLKTFEPQREGAFLAYLRQTLMNAMRNEIRRSASRGGHDAVDDQLVDGGPSPLETAVGSDTLERYERAMAGLRAEQQEAVILRIEMNFTYDQIAEATGKNSANTARMVVTRALLRLAREMDEPGA
jgi:RNA polymerase sigma-70 factor (ECF subfamily)